MASRSPGNGSTGGGHPGDNNDEQEKKKGSIGRSFFAKLRRRNSSKDRKSLGSNQGSRPQTPSTSPQPDVRLERAYYGKNSDARDRSTEDPRRHTIPRAAIGGSPIPPKGDHSDSEVDEWDAYAQKSSRKKSKERVLGRRASRERALEREMRRERSRSKERAPQVSSMESSQVESHASESSSVTTSRQQFYKVEQQVQLSQSYKETTVSSVTARRVVGDESQLPPIPPPRSKGKHHYEVIQVKDETDGIRTSTPKKSPYQFWREHQSQEQVDDNGTVRRTYVETSGAVSNQQVVMKESRVIKRERNVSSSSQRSTTSSTAEPLAKVAVSSVPSPQQAERVFVEDFGQLKEGGRKEKKSISAMFSSFTSSSSSKKKTDKVAPESEQKSASSPMKAFPLNPDFQAQMQEGDSGATPITLSSSPPVKKVGEEPLLGTVLHPKPPQPPRPSARTPFQEWRTYRQVSQSREGSSPVSLNPEPRRISAPAYSPSLVRPGYRARTPDPDYDNVSMASTGSRSSWGFRQGSDTSHEDIHKLVGPQYYADRQRSISSMGIPRYQHRPRTPSSMLSASPRLERQIRAPSSEALSGRPSSALANPESQEWYDKYQLKAFPHDAEFGEQEYAKHNYDTHINQIRDEQERVQKKTFVNWINSYLAKRIPPMKIEDLADGLRDGTRLLALLEVLGGERLPMEKGRVLRRPHYLSNVNTALEYLRSKRIKLVNINAADVVDGRPAVVLGLIWTIILYFQIEENTRVLETLGQRYGSPAVKGSQTGESEDDRSTPGGAGRKLSVPEKWKLGAKKALLHWCQTQIGQKFGVSVSDFGKSWRDGNAFLAIVNSIQPGAVDMEAMQNETNQTRLETAFYVAEVKLGVTRLLDPEDVDVPNPDEKSVMTYVAQFLHKYPEGSVTKGADRFGSLESQYQELRAWLTTKISWFEQTQVTKGHLPKNYDEFQKFKAEMTTKQEIYDRLRQLKSNRQLGISPEAWNELDNNWQKLETQMRHWQWLLDTSLPGEFGQIGEWLNQGEGLVNSDDIPAILNEEAAAVLNQKIEDHKAFFADLPSVQKQFETAVSSSRYVEQIPKDQLQSMAHRLGNIGAKADVRAVRLKFLEHKKLIDEARGLEGRKKDVKILSDNVVQYLNSVSESSSSDVNAATDLLIQKYTTLLESLEERHEKVSQEIVNLEGTDKVVHDLNDKLKRLQKEIARLDAWSVEQDSTLGQMQVLRDQLEGHFDKAKDLNNATRQKYQEYGQSLPAEAGQKLSALEILAESLVGEMDEKSREFERAQTVRSDYAQDLEEVQFWLQRAEAKIQDRSVQPQAIKAQLQEVNMEIGSTADQLERLNKNGQVLVEKSQNPQERDLVQSTCSNVTEQMAHVRHILEQKKMAVGEAIDSWQKFLDLYDAVLAWSDEKNIFVAEPLDFSTLPMAKSKLQEYSTVMKTIKNASKNVAEMNREYSQIGQVADTGDLGGKLHEIEQRKNATEKNLSEKNAMLQEMTEEWEQCERKLKETQDWIARSRSSLASIPNRKSPIRDQLALREKIYSEVTIQRAKVIMSVEKLHVHFPDGNTQDQDVTHMARNIERDLDELLVEIKAQNATLDSCLSQLEQYQQEIQRLRSQILLEEQHLRAVSSPSYVAKNRDKAMTEQSVDIGHLEHDVREIENILSGMSNDDADRQLAITKITVDTLEAMETSADDIESRMSAVPEPERQELGELETTLKGLKAAIAQDKTTADKIRMSVENYVNERRKRNDEIKSYHNMLVDLEQWLLEAQGSLGAEIRMYTIKSVRENMKRHKDYANGLSEKREDVNQMLQQCSRLAQYPDVSESVNLLSRHLTAVGEAIDDFQGVMNLRNRALQEAMDKAEEIVSTVNGDETTSDVFEVVMTKDGISMEGRTRVESSKLERHVMVKQGEFSSNVSETVDGAQAKPLGLPESLTSNLPPDLKLHVEAEVQAAYDRLEREKRPELTKPPNVKALFDLVEDMPEPVAKNIYEQITKVIQEYNGKDENRITPEEKEGLIQLQMEQNKLTQELANELSSKFPPFLSAQIQYEILQQMCRMDLQNLKPTTTRRKHTVEDLIQLQIEQNQLIPDVPVELSQSLPSDLQDDVSKAMKEAYRNLALREALDQETTSPIPMSRDRSSSFSSQSSTQSGSSITIKERGKKLRKEISKLFHNKPKEHHDDASSVDSHPESSASRGSSTPKKKKMKLPKLSLSLPKFGKRSKNQTSSQTASNITEDSEFDSEALPETPQIETPSTYYKDLPSRPESPVPFWHGKQSEEKRKDNPSKSSFFGGLFKFKLPDFSSFKFEGKPTSVEVDKLMKDLPEPDDYAEEEQDWGLQFGRLRRGKDQEEVELHLLRLLKLLHKHLKDLKKQFKDIHKIKDPVKKRKTLLNFQMELGKLEDEVGQLSANLPVDLISPDVHRVVSGCLASMSDDLAEMRASAQADLDGLPRSDVTLGAPSVSLSGDLNLSKGVDKDVKGKKKEKLDVHDKSKSAFFGGLFKMKPSDPSAIEVQGKPSSFDVQKIIKDPPEGDNHDQEEQDWEMLFGKLGKGKDQKEEEKHLLLVLRMMFRQLNANKEKLKLILQIEGNEEKLQSLSNYQAKHKYFANQVDVLNKKSLKI